MAAASLKFDPSNVHDETRAGSVIYDGSAAQFHQWQFNVMMKMSSVKKEDKPKEMANIVQALRGEAATLAMDIGYTDLLNNDGIDKLTKAIQARVFPHAHAEAKELYRIGHKQHGLLSRQPKEAMTNFVARRRRWWKLLKSLDSSIELSETIRGDLLLESSGLNDTQQLMILTSTGNKHEFDVIAQALIDQRSKVHVPQE